jgi:dimethylhistidine N-methyltransferase
MDEHNLQEIKLGLSREPRSLPSKYLYDKIGSELFEKICVQPEYYLTRTEIEILKTNTQEIIELFHNPTTLIEFGSGNSKKTNLLLQAAKDKIKYYVPVDISEEMLENSTSFINEKYDGLKVEPLVADYTQEITFPKNHPESQRIVFFPGSTIGNFKPSVALDFLKRIRKMCGIQGGCLVGVDLHKDAKILNAAYNDQLGITASFNLNILNHVNREYSADFDITQFEHLAFYNETLFRIESYVVSKIKQTVTLGDLRFFIEAGERIHTEYSYKYVMSDFLQLAEKAGFRNLQHWTDRDQFFSVLYLVSI